jgi:predicted RNA-binding protein Jag
VLPEDYIDTNKNILDYCIGGKSKGDWQQVARQIKNGIFDEEKLQKINRYFISKSGVKILKVNKKDKREIQLEAGKWLQSIFNDMQLEPKWENYNIDKKYYLEAIEQEINNIIDVAPNQLTLF